MIVFDVKCGKDHVFEGWFRSSDDFRAQVEAGSIACPVCGDTGVEKALMAPHVATGGGDGGGGGDGDGGKEAADEGKGEERVTLARHKEQAGRMTMMRALKEHVERHFDDVGTGFAEEARKIHYGEGERRNIHGQATRDQARELRDEGIAFGQLPDLPKLDG